MAEAKKAVPNKPVPAVKRQRPAQAAAPQATRPARAKAAAGGKTVKVLLVRSGIGTPRDQRATLRGLGLSRLRQERELIDSPQVRGMLRKVRHLVSVNGQPVA